MVFEVNIQQYRLCCLDTVTTIAKTDWNTLAAHATSGGPFVQYEWLSLLENTGCTGSDSGWEPAHWVVYHQDNLVAIIPGYIKTHSYGEYVFDHSWANAYQQHGLHYYPKWIAAIPFTPVTGPRVLLAPSVTLTDVLPVLSSAQQQWAQQRNISSFHWLFHNHHVDDFETASFATRRSVQFQWVNRGYASFNDFLAALTSRKRRDIRKTRNRLNSGQLTIETLTGDAITERHMETFITCYQDTYLKRSGHTGYLTPAFFRELIQHMPHSLCLVVASNADQPVAAALFLFDHTGLYGRYWGCLQDIDSLHFECCYFRGIEFAIERSLPIFNPGTQGEHKILRGFEPTFCYSQHRMQHTDFHRAVENFLQSEKPIIEQYFNQARDVLPFNQDHLNRYIYAPVNDPNNNVSDTDKT